MVRPMRAGSALSDNYQAVENSNRYRGATVSRSFGCSAGLMGTAAAELGKSADAVCVEGQ
jgi:hypothetical protein